MQISIISLIFQFYYCLENNSLQQRQNHPFIPCESKANNAYVEDRILVVLTCDTRTEWKEFQAMKVWNITGQKMRNNGVFMKNVCKGHNWGEHGFLTKPILYFQYLQSLVLSRDYGKTHVILMDSDTFWSSDTVTKIWNRYDCARNHKDMLISSEMSCWVGRYCKQEDLKRWYSNETLAVTPSFSPFLNSGVIMGLASKVAVMLDYVIKHNQSYYITHTKHKFDDQYAIADYAINVAPEEVQIDFHQQLAASCSIHTIGDDPDIGWPFACKSRSGDVYMHCYDFTTKLARHGYFYVDKSTCLVYKHIHKDLPELFELQTIALDPVIWHGNGAGKRQFLSLAHTSFLCHLKLLNMTEEEHRNLYTG